MLHPQNLATKQAAVASMQGMLALSLLDTSRLQIDLRYYVTELSTLVEDLDTPMLSADLAGE
jgi:hypothetical protein